jgi:DinB family protein
LTASPDPVREAAAYQQHLLALLGGDDPAQVQQSTETTLRAMMAEAGRHLRTRPAESEWSVLELLGHFVDAELVLSGRYRWAVSHDRPELVPYDQALWVSRLHHNDDDPSDLFELFVPLRAANLRLWRRSSADDRQRVAIHAERGPESFEMMFRMLAGHDRFHLNQMEATLSQLSRPPAR